MGGDSSAGKSVGSVCVQMDTCWSRILNTSTGCCEYLGLEWVRGMRRKPGILVGAGISVLASLSHLRGGPSPLLP